MRMQSSGIIYKYQPPQRASKKVKPFLPTRLNLSRLLALGLIALSLGGITGPLYPSIRLETGFAISRLNNFTIQQLNNVFNPSKPLPRSVPIIFNPLVAEDGSQISPVNTDFSLIIPKIGVNAPIVPAVNPANPGEYLEALQKGVAHASTSYFPDEDGTVYLFSHSTNYDWFVKDLNAVFYLLKNLSEGDLIVVFYEGKRYTYRLAEKRITAATEVSYLVPQGGKKRLILQTCWPPGSVAQRLLIFADLIEEQWNRV